jgi:hypothetical protein
MAGEFTNCRACSGTGVVDQQFAQDRLYCPDAMAAEGVAAPGNKGGGG